MQLLRSQGFEILKNANHSTLMYDELNENLKLQQQF
jgi:hypothetical protein